ncbi:MAG: FecR domain-containing protein [Prevotella sp.]|nr:FecR domain-containing protein [Prevotella sp.]
MSVSSRSINVLLRKRLTGDLTQEESEILNRWISEHPADYEQLMERGDLVSEYAIYSSINHDTAWNLFRNQYFITDKHHRLRPYLYTAAAVALLLIVMTPLLFRQHEVVKPVLTAEVKTAMIRSHQTQKEEATLIVGGRRIAVSSEKALLAESENMQTEADFDNRYTLETEKGKEFWVTLDDGTRVHLNYNTTLKYPVRFDSDERTVYLRGEAYFDVTKDADRPFRVITDQGVVKVYGTSFDVNTTERSGHTQVVLVSGSVSVTPVNGHEIMVRPGQMAEFSSAGTGKLVAIDTTPYVSWNTGYYVFDGCPLDRLMQVLSKWSGYEVEFRDASVRSIEFSGNIDKYNDLETTIKAIEFATGIHLGLESGKIIIDK